MFKTRKRFGTSSATDDIDFHVTACVDIVCVTDAVREYLRQKRQIIPSHIQGSCTVISSQTRLSFYPPAGQRAQESAGAAKVPVSSTQPLHHSQSVHYSRAAAVLPADRWLGWLLLKRRAGVEYNHLSSCCFHLVHTPELLSAIFRVNIHHTYSKDTVFFPLCNEGIK